MLFISIPKPCHENWNEMSPREQGAFCTVCSKTVVDFTSLSDEDVKNYFFKNRDQKTCGRFRNSQLTNTDNLLPQLMQASIPFWKKFLAIVIILFGGLLSGCQNTAVGKLKEADAGKLETHLLGDISLQMPDSTFIKDEFANETADRCSVKPDTTEMTIVGEIEAAINVDMGMVSIEDSLYEEPSAINTDIKAKKILDKHGREIKKNR